MLVHTEISIGAHPAMFCLVKTIEFFRAVHTKSPDFLDNCKEDPRACHRHKTDESYADELYKELVPRSHRTEDSYSQCSPDSRTEVNCHSTHRVIKL